VIAWVRRMLARSPDTRQDSRSEELAALAARHARAIARIVKVHPQDEALNDEYRRAERQLKDVGRG
jgi:dsDNA-binding SOS-regulon protein